MGVQANKAVKPRPLEATSIPGLLGLFQNEWDDLMLETFTLKQHLDTTRQELSQALYQHDAACRVIARLVKERDAAREMLAAAQAGAAQSVAAGGDGAGAMDTEEAGLTAAMLANMDATAKKLSKTRRKRAVPDALATADQLASYAAKSSHTIHKSDKPGILCVDVHPTKQNLVVTGGVDKTAQVFDRDAKKVLATLTGHGKKVVSAKFHPTSGAVLTASADKTVKIWAPKGKDYAAAHTLSGHSDEVTGLSLHATGDYFVSSSKDATWAFHDIAQGRTVHTVSGEEAFTCVLFHPDGLILGTGTADGKLRIWDVKEGKNVASFDQSNGGHDSGAVNSICFSENGYHLASAGADGFVRLFDLRKLKNFQSMDLGAGSVGSVAWDYSGKYLACGAADVRVYAVKQWDAPVATYGAHTAGVTGLAWGANAQFLASTSMDRSLKFFAE